MTLNNEIELVTAIIDILTGIISIPLSLIILKKDGDEILKKKWAHFIGILGISNAFGGFIHLFNFDEIIRDIMWSFLFPMLFELVVSFFFLSLYKYNEGKYPNKKILILVYLFALFTNIYQTILGFYRLTEVRVFVVFGILFALPAVILLLISTIKNKESSFKYYIIILLVQLFGTYFQITKTGSFTLFVTFDHNGIYHLCLLLTVVLLFFTASESLNSKNILLEEEME